MVGDGMSQFVRNIQVQHEAMAKVLIVAQDQVLIENLNRELPEEKSFRTATAASGCMDACTENT